MCDISALAKGWSAIGLGRISTLALLYIESLFVLMAVTQGAIIFPLLGAALIVAQAPLAINSARIVLHTVLVYRLLAFSLIFIVAMGIGWSIDVAARIFFALLLIALCYLILVATSRAASIAQTFGKITDTRVLEYALFTDPSSRRRRLQDIPDVPHLFFMFCNVHRYQHSDN